MKIVIFRTGGSILDYKTYNCQEIGLAKSLSAMGHEVYVLMAGSKFTRDVTGNDNPVTVYTLPFKSINQALSLFQGWKSILSGLDPDIIQIHEFGMLMSYLVVNWAKKRNIPTVLIQGPYEPTRKPLFKQLEVMFNKTFGKYILNNVAGIGCKTIRASEYIYSYSERNTMITPVGLDVERFATATDRDWRKDLNIQNKKVLLYVGKLEPRRNPLFLVEIAKNLPSDYVMLIAGDGPQFESAQEQAKGYERIIFLGKLTQQLLPSLYRQSDLFLLASDYEIFGMVIMEAMYFGVPVISSDTAGAETLISNWDDGIIEKKMDVDIWVKDLCSLLNDKTRYAQIAEHAAKKAENHFPWKFAVLKFIDLYESCLRKK